MRGDTPLPSPDPAGTAAELRRELAELDRQLTGLISQRSELLSERAGLTRSLEDQRAELADAQAEIQALRRSSETLGRSSEALSRSSEALSRALRWQLLVHRHELAAARGLTETVQAELARVEQRLSVRAGQLQALRASRSFRLATRLSAVLHPGWPRRPRTGQRTTEPQLGD